jgi:uncharacterized protein YijF (DUF1287 family)
MTHKVGFSKPEIKGKGSYSPPPSKQLDRSCQPGEIVSWKDQNGNEFIGELQSWNSNTAMVNIGSVIKAVEC